MRIDLITPDEIGSVEEADWRRLQRAARPLSPPSLSPGWVRCVGAARPDARVAVVRDGAGRIHGFLPVQAGKGQVVETLGASLDLGCGFVGDPALKWGARDWLRGLRARALEFSGAAENQVEFAAAARGGDIRMIAELHGGAGAYLALRRAQTDTDLLETRAHRLGAIAAEFGAPRMRLVSCAREDFDQTMFWSADAFRRPQLDWEIAALRAAFEREDDSFAGALFTLTAGDALLAGAFFLLDQRSAQLVFYGEASTAAAHASAAIVVADAIAAFAARGIDEVDLGCSDGFIAREFATRRRPVLYGRIRPAERSRFPVALRETFTPRAVRAARSWSDAGPAVH